MNSVCKRTLLFLACSLLMLAQPAKTGSLAGKVTDSSGKGAVDVMLRLEANGTTAGTARTDAEGNFRIENIPPGTYAVQMESSGIRWRNPGAVTITNDATTPVEVTFSQEDTGADTVREVILNADAPTIPIDSSEVARAYDTRMVRSLPLSDRQNQDLIGLMPGVTPPIVTSDVVEDPQHRRIFNVNGLPDWSNSYYQDGSFQSEMFSAKPSRIAPNESVQQLNIATSNFNGEHGFSGGSWINTVTRPGTVRLHGSAFGLHTNEFLTTRHPLDSTGLEPGFNRNQFGGSVGGAIVPEKVFLFGSYEGLMRRGSIFDAATVPSLGVRTGNFSEFSQPIYNPGTGTANGLLRTAFPGNRIPQSAINPAAQALLGYFPQPNTSSSFMNLRSGARLLEDLHRFDGKLDHRFSERSTGFLRYGFTQGSVDRGSILGAMGNGASSELRNHNAVASWTYSVRPQLAGEIRAGYSRYRNEIGPWGDYPGFNQNLAAAGFTNGLPAFSIAGLGSYGLPGNYPSKALNNSYDAATNWNWHNGMHHLKFGFQFVHYRLSGFDAGAFSPRGTFEFGSGGTALNGNNVNVMNPAASGFAAFLLGAPTSAGVSQFSQTPTAQQTLGAAYLSDTINLWSKVYLELGVRYDVYSPLVTRRGSGSVSYDPVSNTVVPGSNTYYAGIIPDGRYDTNNIAPRIGLAIRPFSRLAFRAGYGVHYFPVPLQASALNQAAMATQLGITGQFGTVPFAVPQVPAVNGSSAPNQPLYSAERTDTQTPYVQTYSAMIQGDLGNGVLLDAGYVGNVGRQLPFSRLTNVAMPGTGLLGLPGRSFDRTAQSTLRGTGQNSSYNSLQVNLTKRFAAGLALAAAYTYGKALDYGLQQANPFDGGSNYGPADWDRKHILAVSHLWQLPFGPGRRNMDSGWGAHILGSWELNGILHWATGTPYSVYADPLACACPGVGSQFASFNGATADLNGMASFNPSLFTTPAAGTFGGGSRNLFRGPELFTYDLALFRDFPIGESVKFELRAEVYNLTNSTNYLSPGSALGSPQFGQTIRTFNGMGGRMFQIGGRLLF